jgi:hypothetical protein
MLNWNYDQHKQYAHDQEAKAQQQRLVQAAAEARSQDSLTGYLEKVVAAWRSADE